MPRICEFFGIVIYLYYDDHPPPHFHARYGEEEGVFDLETLGIIAGEVRPRVRALVVEWAALRREDIRRAWEQCRNHQPVDPVSPLE